MLVKGAPGRQMAIYWTSDGPVVTVDTIIVTVYQVNNHSFLNRKNTSSGRLNIFKCSRNQLDVIANTKHVSLFKDSEYSQYYFYCC